jgi:hypothetical protein
MGMGPFWRPSFAIWIDQRPASPDDAKGAAQKAWNSATLWGMGVGLAIPLFTFGHLFTPEPFWQTMGVLAAAACGIRSAVSYAEALDLRRQYQARGP